MEEFLLVDSLQKQEDGRCGRTRAEQPESRTADEAEQY
jgi:hypothetical protein